MSAASAFENGRGRVVGALLTCAALASVGCSGRGKPDAPVTLANADTAEVRGPFVAAEPALLPSRRAGELATLRHAYCQASVAISADVARTVVTDVFVNDGDESAPFAYRFPLPNDATVAGLADYRDGQRFEATIGGRDEARKKLEAAEAKGESAGLAEADGAMGFRMTLTPVAPHETRRVELTYVQTLRPLGGERTFVYPAGFSGSTPAGLFDLEVAVTASRAITSVADASPDGARFAQTSRLRARGALERVGVPLEHDFVARWSESTEPVELAVRAVRGDDTAGTGAAHASGFVEARFAFTRDPRPEAAAPRDIVFVVDTSLSMAGDALEAARRIVEASLANVTSKDRIALVTFDAVVRSGSSLEAASDAAKSRLTGELRGIRASGASNLDAAVDRAHELLAASAHPVLVLATDGQPTVGEDLESLTPATKPEAFAATQVFVALFNYPSRRKPLEALFPATTTVYVPSGAAAEAAVRKVAQLATADTLRDLRVEVMGAEPSTQHGRVPRQLAAGDGLRIAFRADGPVTVRVTGILHGTPLILTKAIDVREATTAFTTTTASAASAASDPLPVEWARLRIADLEAAYREGHDDAVKREITSLGTTFHLVSSMTSLVATSDSLSPDRIMPGDPEIRVRAPKGADAVRAILPWGEIVACTWLEEEHVWFGRFLVPRSVADGLYRVRVFVDEQGVTSLKTTLAFVVDSKAPELTLTAVRANEGMVRLRAAPLRSEPASRAARIRTAGGDVKTVVVRFGETAVHMERRDGESEWNAIVPAAIATTSPRAQLIATDYARNTRTTEVALTMTATTERVAR